MLPDQATVERADGRSQYDYLRRLGEHLIALDSRKRQAGSHGVTAIGVLGSDTYDKLLVLDALREHFPRAVFFTADLDARLPWPRSAPIDAESRCGLGLRSEAASRSAGQRTALPRHLSDRYLSCDAGGDGLGCTEALNCRLPSMVCQATTLRDRPDSGCGPVTGQYRRDASLQAARSPSNAPASIPTTSGSASILCRASWLYWQWR